MSRLIDADIIYQWYRDSFDFEPNEVKFSMLDIRDNLENIPTADVPNMTGDLISRQAAIDEIREWKTRMTVEGLVDHILALPSAEPRKKGKWIDAVLPNNSGGLPVQVCDQCNTFFPLAYTGGGHRFCPNCGCQMNGGEEE